MSNDSTALSAAILHSRHTSPEDLTFCTSMGLVLTSLMLASVISLTVRYFELFNRSDHIVVRIAIGCGTATSIALLGMECYSVYELCQKASNDFASIFNEDKILNLSVDVFVALFASPAYLYYTWRTWNLFHRNYLFLAFTLLIDCIPLSLTLVLVVKGYFCPTLTLQNLPAIDDNLHEIARWAKIIGIGTMATDGYLCISMVLGLYFSKQNFLDMSHSLFRRLTKLAFETMLPPSILALVCLLTTANGLTSDIRRIALFALPVTYYHCLLYCLVARHDLQDVLDKRLAANGMAVHPSRSAKGGRGRDRGGVYVSTTTYVHREDETEQDVDSQQSAITAFDMSPLSAETKVELV